MADNPSEQSLQLAEKTKQQNVGEEDLSQMTYQQQQLISNMFLQIKLISLSLQSNIEGIHDNNLSQNEQKQNQTSSMSADQDMTFSLSAVLQPNDKITQSQQSKTLDSMISQLNTPHLTAMAAPITLPSSRLFKLQHPKSQINSLLLLQLKTPLKSSKLIISLHLHHFQPIPHPSSVVVIANCILNGNSIASLPLSENLPLVNMNDQIIAHCLTSITVLNQETTNIKSIFNDAMMVKERSDDKMKKDIMKGKAISSDHKNKKNYDNHFSILTSKFYKSLSGENVYHCRVQQSQQDKSNTCLFSGEGRILHITPELGEIEVINVENTIGVMSYQSIVRIDDLWLAITAETGCIAGLVVFSKRLDKFLGVVVFPTTETTQTIGTSYFPQILPLIGGVSESANRDCWEDPYLCILSLVLIFRSYGCEGDTRGVLSSCERLPTLDCKWTFMGELVKPRFGHSSIVFNDRLFVFGGIISLSQDYNRDGSIISIEEWNEQQQLWKEYAVVNEKQSYQNKRIVSDCRLLSELFQTADGFSRQGGGNLLIFQNDLQEIEEDQHCLRLTTLNLEDKQGRDLGMVEVFRNQVEQKEICIEDRRKISTLNKLSEQLPLFHKRYIFTKSLLNEDRIDVYSMYLSNSNNNSNSTARACKLAMSIACDNLQRYASERNLTNSLLPSKATTNQGDNQRKTDQPAIFLRLQDNQYLQIIEMQHITDIAIKQHILFSVEFPDKRRFLFLTHVVEMNNGQIFVVASNQGKEHKEHNENNCYIYIPLENRLELLPGLPFCLSKNQYVVYFCEELGLLYVILNPVNQQYCFWYDAIFAKWRRINLESIEREEEENEWNEFKSFNPDEMSVSLIDQSGFMVSLEIAHKERVIAVNIIDLKHATIDIHRTVKSTELSLLHREDQGEEKEETLFALSPSLLLRKKNGFLTPENHNSNQYPHLDRMTVFSYSSSLADLSAIEYVVFMRQSAFEYSLLRFIPVTSQFSVMKCQPQSNLSRLFFNDCACAEIKYLGVLLTGGSHKEAAVKFCRIWRAYSKDSNNSSNANTLNPFEHVSDMLTRRMQHSLVHFRNRFYAIGGAESVVSKSTLKSVESFDLASGTWRQEPNMLLGRKSFGYCSIRDDYILVAGGITEEQYHCSPCLTDSIEVFDGKEWKRLRTKLNSPLEGLRAVLLPSSREIVFVGGKKDRARKEITLLEDFTVEKEEIEKGQSTADKDQRGDFKTEVIDELETYTSSCHVVQAGYDLFVLGGNTLNQVQQLNLMMPGSTKKKCIMVYDMKKYEFLLINGLFWIFTDGNSSSTSHIVSINATNFNWQNHRDSVLKGYSELMKIPNDLSHYGGTQINSQSTVISKQQQSRQLQLTQKSVSQGEIDYQCNSKEFNRYSSIVSFSNGNSIVSGGIKINKQQQQLPVKDVLRFDKKTNRLVKLGEMATPRFGHASMLLSDDSLLLAGGWQLFLISTFSRGFPK